MSTQNSRLRVGVDDGPSIIGVMAVVFIVLKLTGVIAWSWWWVLSPLWIPVLIIAGIGAVVAVAWGGRR